MTDLKSIPEGKIETVEISLLRNNPLNEEIYGTEDVDPDLLRSIQDHGVDTPIEVLPDGTIIKGHRRKLHAEEAGLTEVPVIVRHELNSPEEVGFALIEDNRHQRNRTNIRILLDPKVIAIRLNNNAPPIPINCTSKSVPMRVSFLSPSSSFP